MMNIVVLVSGNGSNMEAIAQAIVHQPIAGKLVAVISNNPTAKALQRAQQFSVATAVVDHRDYQDRAAFDAALRQRIDSYRPDLVILAGFMRILTTEFVSHYSGRMINIHPSLLPKYKGLNTHQKALDNKDHEHGCSVHFVTAELDSGGIIAQARVRIEANDTLDTLSKKVQIQEHILYPACVKLFCDKRIEMRADGVYFDDHKLPEQGIDLTDADF